MNLPIQPPFAPMEARLVNEIPMGKEWSYEPKWDGFRCLSFRDGNEVLLQSKSGQPLARYFPEVVEALENLKANKFVLDGELVIPAGDAVSFDDLLLRLHPAESRIQKLSKRHPALLVIFDLLVSDDGRNLAQLTLQQRRQELEVFNKRYLKTAQRIVLSPITNEIARAHEWLSSAGPSLDGVVAKDISLPYLSGERAMKKIKAIRSVDCVVGGFRYGSKQKLVGSPARFVRRSRVAASRRIYFGNQGEGQNSPDQEVACPRAKARLHRPGSWRTKPLEHRTLRRMDSPQA